MLCDVVQYNVVQCSAVLLEMIHGIRLFLTQ